jgi:hypothetical protein
MASYPERDDVRYFEGASLRRWKCRPWQCGESDSGIESSIGDLLIRVCISERTLVTVPCLDLKVPNVSM